MTTNSYVTAWRMGACKAVAEAAPSRPLKLKVMSARKMKTQKALRKGSEQRCTRQLQLSFHRPTVTSLRAWLHSFTIEQTIVSNW
eukprot:6202251-Pleurochrysis_carterae.AAC.1